jgi:hypothetical protein
MVNDMDGVKEQNVGWTYLQYLRKVWKERGAKNVPDERCSCGFEGHDKPATCEVHEHITTDREYVP